MLKIQRERSFAERMFIGYIYEVPFGVPYRIK